MNLLQKLLKFFILILILSACTSQQTIVVDVAYTQTQLNERVALNKTYEHLEHFDTIDAALYLNTTDFTKIVETSFQDFTQHFKELDAPSFSKASFGKIKLSFEGGVIRSKVDFSFEVDALKRVIYGHLIASHSLKAGDNEFVITTDFNGIELDKIDQSQPLKDNFENKELISNAVKSFLYTLNIEIINMPLRLEVDMNILQGINGKDIFKSAQYKLHSASAIIMQTKMRTYLAYINYKGLLLLGSSEFKESDSYEQYKDLVQLRQLVDTKIDKMLIQSMGSSLEILQKYSSYYISRDYLARQMSKALVKMDLRVINKFFLDIATEKQRFYKKVYFFDKNQLPKCEGVTQNCSKLLHLCQRQCAVKFGVHECIQCEDMKNPFEKVRCVSELEACKTKEDLNLYACSKEEDLCEIDKIEIKTQCEVDNLTQVSMCKEDKEALAFVDDELYLTKLNLNFDIASSYIVQRIKNIKFSKNLESLHVLRDMHISVNSNLIIDINTTKIQDLECKLGIKQALHTHSQIDLVNEIQEIRLSTQRLKNGSIELKAISEPSILNIQMKTNSFETLMKDKNFFLQCNYKNMPMQTMSAQALLQKKDIPLTMQALLGNLEINFSKEELSFIILPIKLNKTTSLYPTIQNKAMVFARQNR